MNQAELLLEIMEVRMKIAEKKGEVDTLVKVSRSLVKKAGKVKDEVEVLVEKQNELIKKATEGGYDIPDIDNMYR